MIDKIEMADEDLKFLKDEMKLFKSKELNTKEVY